MRWIPVLVIFIITYIEISLFIQIANVLGVLTTLLLLIATSFIIGVSLVRAQGLRILREIQVKLACGESPVGEMIKSVSLLLAGFLLLLPGFFTDFLGLLLLLPPIQNLLTLRLLPYLRFQRGSVATPWTGGDTFKGEYYRHDLPHDKLNDRHDDEE